MPSTPTTTIFAAMLFGGLVATIVLQPKQQGDRSISMNSGPDSMAADSTNAPGGRRPLALARRGIAQSLTVLGNSTGTAVSVVGGFQGESAMAKFMNMTTEARGAPLPEKFEKIPGLTDLDLYLWETNPKPVYMLYNSHLKWYVENMNEKRLIGLMRYILTTHTPDDGIVIDLGINDGYISALAASYGYSVVSIDGQPECVRRFHFANAVNGWRDVRIYNNIVMEEKKVMEIPNGVCGGGSRYQGKTAEIHATKGVTNGMQGASRVRSVAMDTLVPEEDVIFFHLDVEGAELSVMRSAAKLFGQGRVHNIVWEFAPHRWADIRAEALADIQRIMKPYTCRHITKVPLDPVAGTDMGETIQDWPKFYAECEAEKKITDVWCQLTSESR